MTANFNAHRNLLKEGEVVIREFPTDICQIGNLDGRIYVLLDPFGTDDSYAVQNVWCLEKAGKLLWKAPPLKLSPPNEKNHYSEFMFYDELSPKMYIQSFNDKRFSVVDAVTGAPVPYESGFDSRIFYRPKMLIMPRMYEPSLPWEEWERITSLPRTPTPK